MNLELLPYLIYALMVFNNNFRHERVSEVRKVRSARKYGALQKYGATYFCSVLP